MDRNNEQCIFTGYWKNYKEFVLDKVVEWKRDNALLLLSQLALAVLATLNIDPCMSGTVIEDLLAAIVLVANQKRGDFILQFTFDDLEPHIQENSPRSRLLQGLGINPESMDMDPPMSPVQIARELLFLQNRHVPNTEVHGTPYVCDHEYDKILHRVLKACLHLLSTLTDLHT
jgi:hypothetical protein